MGGVGMEDATFWGKLGKGAWRAWGLQCGRGKGKEPREIKRLPTAHPRHNILRIGRADLVKGERGVLCHTGCLQLSRARVRRKTGSVRERGKTD